MRTIISLYKKLSTEYDNLLKIYTIIKRLVVTLMIHKFWYTDYKY